MANKISLIRANVLQRFVDYIDRNGGEISVPLEKSFLTLDWIKDPLMLCSEAQVGAFLYHASEVLNDPCLGLSVARESSIDGIKIFGSALLQCRDLESALNVFQLNISRLLSDGDKRFAWYRKDGKCYVWCNDPPNKVIGKYLHFQSAMGYCLNFLQEFAGDRWTPTRIHVRCVDTEPWTNLPSVRDAEMVPNSDFGLIEFPEELLSCAHKGAVPDVPDIKTKDQVDIPNTTTKAVEILLLKLIPLGVLKITDFAHVVRRSTRSIQLDLQEENTSYTKVLTKAKMAIAKQLLAEQPSLSIENIGKLVGYEHSSSFAHAFQKIVDIPPLKYRKEYARNPKNAENNK